MEAHLEQWSENNGMPRGERPGAIGIAIASGKGGVGKTNVVANLAASLAAEGHSVLVVDADFGLSNLDVLLGLSPRYHVGHVLTGDKKLDEVIVDGPGGIRILPAASGLQSLASMTRARRDVLLRRIEVELPDVDYLLMDTSAGISENVTGILGAMTRSIVVTNPEPTSLVDAYALIKVMQQIRPEIQLELLVNSVRAESEAKEVYEQIRATTKRFLSMSVGLFGWVDRDPTVRSAVRDQKLVVLEYPDSAAAESFRRLARKLDAEMTPRGRPKARVLRFPPPRRSGDGQR